MAAGFYGVNKGNRRHKDVRFHHDVRVLAELMIREEVYEFRPNDQTRTLWVAAEGKKGDTKRQSAVVDLIAEGSLKWSGGYLTEYIRATTNTRLHNYPLDRNM